MPAPFPKECRDDVVRVARQGGIPWTQIAKDFGVSGASVHTWSKTADIEDGTRPGSTRAESAELREVK